MHRAKRRRRNKQSGEEDEDEDRNDEAEDDMSEVVQDYPGSSSYNDQDDKKLHRHLRRSGRIRATRTATAAEAIPDRIIRDEVGESSSSSSSSSSGRGVGDDGSRRRRLTVYDSVAAGRPTIPTRTAQALAMAGADPFMGRRVYRSTRAMPAPDEVLGARLATGPDDDVIIRSDDDGGDEHEHDASLGAHYAAVAGLHVPPNELVAALHTHWSHRADRVRNGRAIHRALDGSALVALGLLLEAAVDAYVAVQPPQGGGRG
ncbi:hypothetical protein V1519DRAFT_289506 [Lipomyces tetrasporus]